MAWSINHMVLVFLLVSPILPIELVLQFECVGGQRIQAPGFEDKPLIAVQPVVVRRTCLLQIDGELANQHHRLAGLFCCVWISFGFQFDVGPFVCLLYTSPSPRDS